MLPQSKKTVTLSTVTSSAAQQRKRRPRGDRLCLYATDVVTARDRARPGSINPNTRQSRSTASSSSSHSQVRVMNSSPNSLPSEVSCFVGVDVSKDQLDVCL